MISRELQSQLSEQVISTQDVSELRTLIAKIQSALYQHSATELESSLHNNLPLKFSFLHTFLSSTKDTAEQEKSLHLLDEYLASLEVMYLTLSYSPTAAQLHDFVQIFKHHSPKPFVLKVKTDETLIGEVTWELYGQRHHHTVFSRQIETTS